MSTTIDERVVAMKFDNGLFQRGVSSTMSALDRLTARLALKGGTNGFDQVEQRANRLHFGGIETGLNSLMDKFKAMSIVGITALTNITNKAVDAGLNLGKSLTVAPIMDGFSEYELKMGSIQTILANTSRDGTKLKDVSTALAELNTYADQTIYNFGDMTKNIGLFTNAGIKLKPAVAMIKGFSNEAAMSGTSASGAAAAAYQLSQALSKGKVTLEDWKSLTNNNMGSKLMQADLVALADGMGAFKDTGTDANKVQKDFNGSLEKGWLKADVMSKYLQIMATDFGSMNAKQLAAQKTELKQLGMDDKQIDSIIKKQKMAQEAATKVRTLTQLFGTLKESIGSGWSDTFEQVFGNFDEATVSFTKFSEIFGKVAGDSADARKKLIGDWKALGGRKAIIDGLIAGFEAFQAAIKPIKDAMRDIFPPMTGARLAEISKAFRDFMLGLKMGEKTAFKVRLIFQGFFAALDIGWIVIKKVAGMVKNLLGLGGVGSGKFLDFAVKIANWVTGLRYAIKYGEGLNNFFKGLEGVLRVPIQFIKTLGSVLSTVVEQFGKASPAVDKVNKNLTELGDAGSSVSDKILGFLKAIVTGFASISPAISEFTSNFVDTLRDGFSNGDMSKIVDMFNTGFLGLLTLTLRNFMKNGLSLDLSGGMFENVNGVLGALTGNLKAMQQNVKASMILKIAGALALLALSAIALAMIDPVKLATAMGALTVMFGQLALALLAFDKASGFGGAAKLPLLAAGLTLLAIAIGLLTISVKVLSTMSWDELLKGMTGLGVVLGMLAGFTQLLANNAGRMLAAGAGFLLLSVAIGIFVFSIKQIGEMDFDTLKQGLIGLGGVLAALALFTRLAALNKIGLSSGAGLILLGVALKIIASAVQDFGKMSWEVLGKGFAALAVGLVAMGLALRAIPKSALLQGAALVVVALALKMLVGVVKDLGSMDLATLGKGLGTMAAGLGLIAIALKLMPIGGAAALWVAVDAITNLATVMSVLAKLGLAGTVAALATLAGALAVLGLAGLVMAPVLPVLQSLGFAILTMGIGAAAAGIGLMMAATGLVALSATGVAAGVAITAIASAIIGVLPAAMKALAVGIVLFAEVIGNAAPVFVVAMVKLITGLLTAISIVAPRIIDTLVNLILMLLNKLAIAVPKFVDAGMRIIIGFINGISARIGELVTAGANFIVKLLDGLGRNLGKVIDAGVRLIKKFLDGIAKAVPDVIDAGMKMVIDILNGVAEAIRKNSQAMADAGANVASAIVDGLVNGLRDMGGRIIEKARSLASDALNAFKSIFDINSPSREMYKIGKYVVEGFVKGLDGNKESIQKSFEAMKKMLADLKKSSKEEMEEQQKKLYKLTHARKKDKKAIAATRAALATATSEYKKSSAAYTNLTKNWTDDKNRLGQLATQYDAIGVKLKAANQKLADAKKTRDDYNNSIKDQYNDLPTISGETKLQDFANDIRKKIEDNKVMLNKMTELRKLGLNDTMFKELMAKGTDALPFIDELLGTGKSGVTQINTLSSQLDSSAAALGKSASTALYQAAVDSAAGLVKGLQNQQKNIEKQMDIIAAAMVKSIKKSLGIKSPSREFMAVGKYSAQGVAKGLENYGHLAEEASKNVGIDAINAMRKTIVGLDDVVNGGVDMRPVIRPVLDLTDIKDKAGYMDRMLAGKSVSASATYGQAKGASVGYADNRRDYGVPETSAPVGKQLTYIQNNYSPKAIGAAETYRNTNNQLSRLKGALGK